MPTFNYKVSSRSGKIIQGSISAENKIRAKIQLINKGYRILKLKLASSNTESVKKNFIYKDANGSIQINIGSSLPTIKELAVFTKQFSMMIENGIPLLKCISLIAEQQKKADFKEILKRVYKDIEEGSNFSEALEKYPYVFDSLYVAMVRAGEASGRLDIILKQLVKYIEKSAKIKAQVKSAMMYPLIIVFVATSVIVLLLVFVVPSFAKQFADSGKELPALTKLVLEMSDALSNNFLEIIIFLFSSIFGFTYWKNTQNGRVLFDKYILKSPLFGNLLTKISIGRFCSTMSTMLNSGVPILEALNICAASSGNKEIETFILSVREDISKGQSFFTPLEKSTLIPKMVSSMVAVGESTGTLDETLAKVTEIYDEEIDNSINAMMSMIEPLMIVVIGGIVGIIAIAMYLPIFDMASTM